MLLIRKVEKSLQHSGNNRRVLHAHFCIMAFEDNMRYFMFGQGFELELDTTDMIISVFNVYNQEELMELKEIIAHEMPSVQQQMEDLILRSPMVAVQITGKKRVAMTATRMSNGHTRLIATGFVPLKDD